MDAVGSRRQFLLCDPQATVYIDAMKKRSAPRRLPARIGTFRQLEILLKVAECGGVAAAAEALHLSQPSASMQLRKLSESVGIPLYESSGRRIRLTHAGEIMVRHARDVFACIERLDMELDALEGMRAGRLSLGVVSSAEYFIPHLLGPFFRRYPQIEVNLEVANRATLEARFNDDRDDLYIFGTAPPAHNASSSALGPNHLVVLAPASHPLASRKRLSWRSVADEPFVVREPGSGARAAIERHLDDRGLVMQHKMTIASNQGIKHAVLARLGLAIMPALCLDAGDEEGLIELPVAGFPIKEQWSLVGRADKQYSLVAETFRDYVLSDGSTMLREALGYWERHKRPKLPSR
tara:strand:- start:71968 stop:73020 length:1053 start_codon:yes stop_codon:yes gene_type:complete